MTTIKHTKTRKKNRKKKTAKRTASKKFWFVLIGVGVVLLAALLLFVNSQKLSNNETVMLFIPTGSDYEAVKDSLNAHNCIGNALMFNTMARIRKYTNHVKGGCYKLKPHLPYWLALNKLYYGNQDAIKVTINKHRTKKQLCDYLGGKLEMNSSDMLKLLDNDSICALYDRTPQTIIGLFVQNTYDIYWNSTPQKLLDRMNKESKRFWNSERTSKRKALKLSESEVITLASIVEEETNKNDEKPTIASVYLNRLRKGMLLQADPTLKYAVGDFTIRRLLNKHMESDSPYNTYKHTGLPPGPICIPGPASIDAVLANIKTDYLYFCAKADFSGYHAFASTLAEHNANAAAFHAEMNRRKIYK